MTLFFSAFFKSLCAKIFDNDERIIQEKCEDPTTYGYDRGL